MCGSLLALSLAGCGAAAAQDEVAAQDAAGGSEGGVGGDVLSPYEVASAAQQATTELARVRARVHHVRDLEHHVVVIEQLGRRVRRLRVDSDLDMLESEPRRELRNLHEQWEELDTRLSETSEALEATSSELEAEAARLRALSERWQRTETAAAEGDYPETARRQIREVVSTAGEVEAELRAHLERVLSAQSTLASHAIATGDVLAEIDRAIEVSRQRLFTRTHPPGLGPLPDVRSPTLWEQLEHSAIHHAHALDRFAAHLGARVYVHGILVFALLALLYWLRREHQPELMPDATVRPFERPIVITIFVALLLVRPLHPLAARAVVELSQLLAIGPLLTIAMPSRSRRVTHVVVALYVLDWARLTLEERGLEHRIVLALIAAAATVAFAWCAYRSTGPARPAWGLASLASAVGVAADLAGFVPISALVVEGVIASAFFAAVLLALHRVVMGTTDAALSTAAARNTVLGRYAQVTRQVVRRASQLALGLSWGWITLDYFQLGGAFRAQAERVLAESVQLGELEISIGDVFAFVIGIWAAVVLSRVLARTLQEDVAPRFGVGPGVPAAAALVVRYAVLALGFVLAASAAGIGLAQLSLFAGALGVGVGFGLQNIVANFVAGLLLVFERPIKVGDTVDVAGHRGVVREIGIRASTIRVLSGADIVMPNSQLTESEVINWTHTDSTLRVDVPIGVAYGSDLQRVRDALHAAATSVDVALEDPPPAVLMVGFGDSSLDFQVRVWIADAADHYVAQSTLALAIHDALGEAGIAIPFPQRDVHIHNES